MNMLRIKFINFCYLMRLFKDKSYHSFLNWYYGHVKHVDRIYKENETIYSHLYKLSNVMTPIIDNIILGNSVDASFYFRLEDSKIGTIINVTDTDTMVNGMTEISNYFTNDFTYYNIKIKDNNREQFTNDIFDNVCKFIDNQSKYINGQSCATTLNQFDVKKDRPNILIHCYMGSSRSATVTAAYMIYKYGYSVDR